MLRSGIVGCGQIADQHADAILTSEYAELSAVCDIHDLMAMQLSERYGTGTYFRDLDEFLGHSDLDVVHITTPGHTHYPIALKCLDAGCNIYVEKPFSLTAQEAEEIIGIASRKGLKVTTGHNLQYSPAFISARNIVERGYLGGKPVHLESYYGYELGGVKGARALLGNSAHWLSKLPGGFLQNLISHGIGKIVEFLEGDDPTVIATAFQSPIAAVSAPAHVVDELRTQIISETGQTAYFTFSTQMRPISRSLNLYGTDNGIVIDDDKQIVVRLPGTRRKSYLENFVSPVMLGRQYMSAASQNIRRFVHRRLHPNSSIRHLVSAFYRSIVLNQAPPISYRDILVTAKIMDMIFEQIAGDDFCRSATQPKG